MDSWSNSELCTPSEKWDLSRGLYAPSSSLSAEPREGFSLAAGDESLKDTNSKAQTKNKPNILFLRESIFVLELADAKKKVV